MILPPCWLRTSITIPERNKIMARCALLPTFIWLCIGPTMRHPLLLNGWMATFTCRLGLATLLVVSGARRSVGDTCSVGTTLRGKKSTCNTGVQALGLPALLWVRIHRPSPTRPTPVMAATCAHQQCALLPTVGAIVCHAYIIPQEVSATALHLLLPC